MTAASVVPEDSPGGIEAAKAAGMRCIGVGATRPLEKLSRADLAVERLGRPAGGGVSAG